MALAKQLREQKPPGAKERIQGSKPEAPYPPWRPATGGPSLVRPTLKPASVTTGGPETKVFVLVKPPGAKADTQGYQLEAPTLRGPSILPSGRCPRTTESRAIVRPTLKPASVRHG